MLEIGSVLPHYFRVKRDVLDKYEHGIFRKVINEDIASWRPTRKYQLVFSISTIEHVGWDETPRRPEKVLEAFSNIQRMLAPSGQSVITFSVGQNRYLDQRLRGGDIPFTRCRYLKRISVDNAWRQVDADEAFGCKYNYPFKNGNAVVFMETQKDA